MILKKAGNHAADLAELERLRNASPGSLHGTIPKQIGNIRSGAAGERSAAHSIDRKFRLSDRPDARASLSDRHVAR